MVSAIQSDRQAQARRRLTPRDRGEDATHLEWRQLKYIQDVLCGPCGNLRDSLNRRVRF